MAVLLGKHLKVIEVIKHESQLCWLRLSRQAVYRRGQDFE
jgi:hypothetical protein